MHLLFQYIISSFTLTGVGTMSMMINVGDGYDHPLLYVNILYEYTAISQNIEW